MNQAWKIIPFESRIIFSATMHTLLCIAIMYNQLMQAAGSIPSSPIKSKVEGLFPPPRSPLRIGEYRDVFYRNILNLRRNVIIKGGEEGFSFFSTDFCFSRGFWNKFQYFHFSGFQGVSFKLVVSFKFVSLLSDKVHDKHARMQAT